MSARAWLPIAALAAAAAATAARQDSEPLPAGALLRLKGACAQYQVGFSPDGKMLAAGHSTERKAKLWDVASGKVVRACDETDDGGAACLAISPDGRILARGHANYVHLWQVESGKSLGRLNRIEEWGDYVHLAFSPDGRRLAAAASYSKVARVWDVTTGKTLCTFKDHEAWVRRVAFLPDGKRVASLGDDKSIRIWSAESGEEEVRIDGPEKGLFGMALSPDGTLAAAGDGAEAIHLWSVSDGVELGAIPARNPRFVSFSPDGRMLASSFGSENLALCEVASGQAFLKIPTESAWVPWLAFSPDGHTFATPASIHSILLWDSDPACWETRRNNTLDELWKTLAGSDVIEARKAIWALGSRGAEAADYLRKALNAPPPEHLQKLIEDLNHDDPARRDQAAAVLEYSSAAAPAIRKALEGTLTQEMRSRLLEIQSSLERPVAKAADLLRRARAIQALERLGAKDALKELAKTAPLLRERRDAAAALERLDRRPAK